MVTICLVYALAYQAVAAGSRGKIGKGMPIYMPMHIFNSEVLALYVPTSTSCLGRFVQVSAGI